MTLTFLGTRANIDIRSRRHRRHTSTLVSHRGTHVMIDCGGDWLTRLRTMKPTAMVLTHGHPDHLDGLRRGAPCAVYATADVWRNISAWPIDTQRQLDCGQPVTIGGIRLEAFPVDHSIRAPAVGYRIAAGRTTVFYVPDVLVLPDAASALSGVALYVGDGASVERPIVRRRDGIATGHASIAAQLRWCAEAAVPRAIFTHCGTQIVAGGKDVERRISTMGTSCGIATEVAFDGWRVTVR